MKLIGNLKVTVDPKTYQPELHVTVALPLELTQNKDQIDAQKFLDEFLALLVPKVKEVDNE